MAVGDKIEIVIEGIGTLSNTVVAKEWLEGFNEKEEIDYSLSTGIGDDSGRGGQPGQGL